MAIGASILRGEIRRHLLMNVGLVATCVVSATVVTNERGLFVPITVDMSDTSRAFAAMFTQSHLLPDREITNVQMVTPLAPFEVTADSRDLRRRLMDALATENDPTVAAGGVPGTPSEFSQNAAQMPTLDNQVLSLNSPGSTPAGSAPAAGTTGGSSQSSSSSGNSTTVASSTAPAATPAATTTSSSTPTTTNSSQPLTVASAANNPAAAQSSAGTTALTNNQTDDSGTSLGGSTGSDQNATGPAAVPEPSVWAMLIAGFGMIGYVLRSSGRRRKDQAEVDAIA